MNYLLFNVTMLIANIIVIVIFSLTLMLILSPIGLLSKLSNRPMILIKSIFYFSGLYQVFFWGLWGAVCVLLTLKFIQKPEVDWIWLYWITGFFWCTSLINWFTQKELQMTSSYEEVNSIRKGAFFYKAVAVVAFILFAFSPNLSLIPYGWILKPFNFDQSIKKSSISSDVEEVEARSSVDSFFEGYDYSTRGSEKVAEFLRNPDLNTDIDEINELFLNAYDSFSKCDIEVLDKVYPELGTKIKTLVIPSLEITISQMSTDLPISELEKADLMIMAFSDWLYYNWEDLLFRLNSVLGYEISNDPEVINDL